MLYLKVFLSTPEHQSSRETKYMVMIIMIVFIKSMKFMAPCSRLPWLGIRKKLQGHYTYWMYINYLQIFLLLVIKHIIWVHVLNDYDRYTKILKFMAPRSRALVIGWVLMDIVLTVNSLIYHLGSTCSRQTKCIVHNFMDNQVQCQIHDTGQRFL